MPTPDETIDQPNPAAGAQDGGQDAPDAGREPVRPQITREQEDAIAGRARKQAEAETRKERERAEALEAEVAKYREAEEARRRDEMTEAERLQAQSADLARQLEEERSARAHAERNALRAQIIARDGATLPAAYKALVGGDTEEDIAASLASAQAAFDADKGGVSASIIGELSRLTPEEIATKYGEEGTALAARLKGEPVAIGAPSNAGKQPPAPPDAPHNAGLRTVMEQRGSVPEAQRKRSWVQQITGH